MGTTVHLVAEAVVQRRSAKELFWKILQNYQKNKHSVRTPGKAAASDFNIVQDWIEFYFEDTRKTCVFFVYLLLIVFKVSFLICIIYDLLLLLILNSFLPAGNNHTLPSVAFHMETNHSVCTANKMTGFFIKCNKGLKWVKPNWKKPV